MTKITNSLSPHSNIGNKIFVEMEISAHTINALLAYTYISDILPSFYLNEKFVDVGYP